MGNCTGHSLLNLEYTVWQEPEKSGFFFFFFLKSCFKNKMQEGNGSPTLPSGLHKCVLAGAH